MRSQGLQWGLPEVFSVLYNPSSMSVNQYFQFIMGKEYIISYELNEILKTGICQLATSHSINWNSLRFGKSAYQEFFQLKLLLKYLNREDRETSIRSSTHWSLKAQTLLGRCRTETKMQAVKQQNGLEIFQFTPIWQGSLQKLLL